jgi:uncharacterized membrane protein YfcA
MTTFELNLLLGSLAAVGGFISAIAGSSGMLTLPALLMAGMPAPLALGTNKFYTTMNLSASTIKFYREKIFDPRFWWVAAMATLLGAVVGVILVQIANPEFLKKALPVLMILAAAYSLSSKSHGLADHVMRASPNTLFAKVSSFLIGIYSGFIGAGTSLFWIALLRKHFGLGLLEANAVANFMSFVSNIMALLVFILFGEVNFMLGLLMAVSGAVGAYFGAHIAIKFGRQIIKPAIAITTCVLSVKLLLSPI